jgi:hypothetical protein
MPGRAGGAPPPQGIASASCRADHSRRERECHFARDRRKRRTRHVTSRVIPGANEAHVERLPHGPRSPRRRAPLCSIGHPYGALSSTVPEFAPRPGDEVRAAWRGAGRFARRPSGLPLGRLASAAGTVLGIPLFDRHEEGGAKLVPFAGWEMRCSTRGSARSTSRSSRSGGAVAGFTSRRRPRRRSVRAGAGRGRAGGASRARGPGGPRWRRGL